MSAPEPPFPKDSSREEPGPPGTSAPLEPSPASSEPAPPDEEPTPRRTTTEDPLRHSRTSGVWAAVVLLVVVLVLLAIFVLQNTQKVEVSFLGWTGQTPLAAALMIAAAAGLLLAAAAGTLRILQLRRRVKRDRRA